MQKLAVPGVALLAMGSLGCPSPSIYGTPRTTPRGRLQHTFALEGIHLRGVPRRSGVFVTGADGTSHELRSETTFTSPSLPLYQLRYGLTERLDVGVRIGSVLGADLKWNLWRSSALDVALDTAVQGFPVVTVAEGAIVGHGHLTVLLGFNPSERVTLVVSPGLVVALAAGRVDYTAQSILADRGVMARLGLGVNLRLSERLAVQPEITAMRAFNTTEGLTFVFGVGVGFGALPTY